MDEFFTMLKKTEENQSPCSKRWGGILNLLSGLFMTGTIGVGLLFSIIFIDPQSTLRLASNLDADNFTD